MESWLGWNVCPLRRQSNTWPPPRPSLDARSASWEEECVLSANGGTGCLGEAECASGWDVLGLCVRVSSWASLSGSCLGPSDNYSENLSQCFLRTGEKHHPGNVCGIIDSRMDSQSCATGGEEMSLLLAKDQGQTGPIVKCSSPCEHGLECGVKGCRSEFFKMKRTLQLEKVIPA